MSPATPLFTLGICQLERLDLVPRVCALSSLLAVFTWLALCVDCLEGIDSSLRGKLKYFLLSSDTLPTRPNWCLWFLCVGKQSSFKTVECFFALIIYKVYIPTIRYGNLEKSVKHILFPGQILAFCLFQLPSSAINNTKWMGVDQLQALLTPSWDNILW